MTNKVKHVLIDNARFARGIILTHLFFGILSKSQQIIPPISMKIPTRVPLQQLTFRIQICHLDEKVLFH